MLKPMFKNLFGSKKGAALVEYGLLIAGVALISAASVSVFGAKTGDLVAAVATVLPGAHATDNARIVTGKLIETTDGGLSTDISLDMTAISANRGDYRLGDNLLGTTNNVTGPLTNLLVQANNN
jgi:pilus assembly protein Flp/PilA